MNKQKEQAAKQINYIFEKLKAIFPAAQSSFNSSGLEPVMKQEWLTALIENKINTPEKLNRGFANARKSESPFFPSVGKFIGWCKKPIKHPSHIMALPKPDYSERRLAGQGKLAQLRESQGV